MLAMADRAGRVQASIPGLANRARVTLEECEHALERFMAPDRYSRTPDNDGRRIEPIDGGWRLLNYEKYRERRDEEARKDYMRGYMRDYRKQGKFTVNPDKPQLAQAEAEAEAEESKKTKVAPLALPAWLDVQTWDSYVQSRKAKTRTPAALRAALKKLDGFREQGFDPNEIVATSLANGWQGLFPPSHNRGPSQAPDYSSLVDK